MVTPEEVRDRTDNEQGDREPGPKDQAGLSLNINTEPCSSDAGHGY